MEMTRGYAENEWSVVNIAEMFCEVWAIIIIKINTISSLLIYFASSFQSEVFFFYEILTLHPFKAHAENCI